MVSIHEVERLINQLDNPIRAAKIKAAGELQSLTIYPEIISDSTIFIQKCFIPIVKHLSNTTELIREISLDIIEKSIHQLCPEKLEDILSILIPAIYSRLQNEKIEPSEQIRYLFMKQLLTLIQIITPNTTPNTFNSYVSGLLDPLRSAFLSEDPKMKIFGCQVLDEVVIHSSLESLLTIASSLSRCLRINCEYRHFDVRKRSLHSLSLLYVHSGAFADESDLFLNLHHDKNSNVRKELISFCKLMLTSHPHKEELYSQYLIPLLYFSCPLVKQRPISIQHQPEFDNRISEEAQLSFHSMNEIGLIEMEKNSNLDGVSIFDLNQEYIANEGIVQIVQTSAQKLLDHLLFLIHALDNSTRHYGFSALKTFLQLSGQYSQRYIPHIIQKLSESIRNKKEDLSNALQCQAILSSFVSSKDILMVLGPQIKEQGPIEIILLIVVTVINSDLDNETLKMILNKCFEFHLYDTASLIKPLTELSIAMTRFGEFMTENEYRVILFIIRLCEYSDLAYKYKDTMNIFLSSFDITSAFSNHLNELLSNPHKTSEYLNILLKNSTSDSILANQELVYNEILDNLNNHECNHMIIEKLISHLAYKHVFPPIRNDLLFIILDDIHRFNDNNCILSPAINALRALLENDLINKNTILENQKQILKAIFDSLDNKSDDIRISTLYCLLSFVKNLDDCSPYYSDISLHLCPRLNDRINEIRLISIEILCFLLPKCIKFTFANRDWADLLGRIDDEDEEIQNAYAKLVKSCAQIPEWKEQIIQTLKEIRKRYSTSMELCFRLISELE